MYNPAPFPEQRIEVLHAFIREHPLAAIVSHGENGLEAAHVPVVQLGLAPEQRSKNVLASRLSLLAQK